MQLHFERFYSPDTYKVVDTIVDALTSQRPQTRYCVGLDAKLMVFLSYLPTFIGDYVLRVKKHKWFHPGWGRGNSRLKRTGVFVVPCTRLPRLQFELTNRHSAVEKNFTVLIQCKFTRKALKSGNFSHWKLHQILKKRNLQFQNHVRL